MININLLPKFQSVSIQWLMVMLISFLIIISLHEQCKTMLLEKQHKITVLKKEVQAINAEISNLQHKKQLVLFPNNPDHTNLPVLLKKLSHTIPVGLYLTELTMTKNNLKLIGHAEKTDLISNWATLLTAAHFTVSLQEIMRNKVSDSYAYQFTLQTPISRSD